VKKICRLVAFVAIVVSGLSASLKYEVKATLLGKVGEVEIFKNKDSSSVYDYTIRVRSSGLAALLSGNRRDEMYARGVCNQGVCISSSLRIETLKKKKRRSKEYIFDKKAKSITKRKRSWKNSTLVAESSKKLPYYTRLDPVGLYFAVLRDLVPRPGSDREYKIVGVEKAGGKVEMVVPEADMQKALNKKHGTNGLLMIYMIVKGEVLGRKNRKVLMAMDKKSGIVEKAWLSSMPVVGTVTIRRISTREPTPSKK